MTGEVDIRYQMCYRLKITINNETVCKISTLLGKLYNVLWKIQSYVKRDDETENSRKFRFFAV